MPVDKTQMPDDYGGMPYMPDRSTSIMDSFDLTDIIEEIKYRLMRYEINETIDKVTNKKIRVWKKPLPIATKKMVGVRDDGSLIFEESTEEIKPMLNEYGIHAIMALLTGFLNRNNTMSFIPIDGSGRDFDNWIKQTCKPVGDAIIDNLMYNYKKYAIENPQDMELIYWVIMPNVDAALRQSLGDKSRHFIKDSLAETKTFVERGAPGMMEMEQQFK